MTLVHPRRKYVVAAGGRIIIPPYPAAHELSGIYRIKYARGVDTREVKSYFDKSRPLVSRLYVLRLSRCFSNAFESSSVGSPPLQQPQALNRPGSPVSPQIDAS